MQKRISSSRENQETRTVSRALVWLMAIGAGVGVANVYYIQPAIPLVQTSLGITTEKASFVPAVSQFGYAAGMLLLAPFGDIMDRKLLVLIKLVLLTAALLATAAAPSLSILLATSLLLGLLSSVGQDFVPVIASMATDNTRGRMIGLITTGLLSGILLSRTLGGIVAAIFDWRMIYLIAAFLTALVCILIWLWLPTQPPTIADSYSGAIRSLVALTRKHAILRKSFLTQALLAATLGTFWTTLAFKLAEPPLYLGANVAGAFGLAGAAGAFGASLFGHFADQKGPMIAIRTGCLLVSAAFALMLVTPHSIIALIIGAVLFDLGVMAGLVSHQMIVNSVAPDARSRLNGLLMTAAMTGMSLGAIAGGWAWDRYGWAGVCLASIAMGLLALIRSILPPSTHSFQRK